MIISQPGLTRPFLNLLNDRDIDWEDNCIFEKGKVVGFKTDKISNNYHMHPIPSSNFIIDSAKEALKTLHSVMQPASYDQIAIEIKKLSLHCGKTNKSPEEMKYIFLDYCKDLESYPIRLIQDACGKYRKLPEGNNFMPSSGKLISLMEEKLCKMQFYKKRIEKILGKSYQETSSSSDDVLMIL